MKCDQVREFGQILLNDGRVVLPEEVVQVFRNEGRQASVSQRCSNHKISTFITLMLLISHIYFLYNPFVWLPYNRSSLI